MEKMKWIFFSVLALINIGMSNGKLEAKVDVALVIPATRKNDHFQHWKNQLASFPENHFEMAQEKARLSIVSVDGRLSDQILLKPTTDRHRYEKFLKDEWKFFSAPMWKTDFHSAFKSARERIFNQERDGMKMIIFYMYMPASNWDETQREAEKLREMGVRMYGVVMLDQMSPDETKKLWKQAEILTGGDETRLVGISYEKDNFYDMETNFMAVGVDMVASLSQSMRKDLDNFNVDSSTQPISTSSIDSTSTSTSDSTTTTSSSSTSKGINQTSTTAKTTTTTTTPMVTVIPPVPASTSAPTKSTSEKAKKPTTTSPGPSTPKKNGTEPGRVEVPKTGSTEEPAGKPFWIIGVVFGVLVAVIIAAIVIMLIVKKKRGKEKEKAAAAAKKKAAEKKKAEEKEKAAAAKKKAMEKEKAAIAAAKKKASEKSTTAPRPVGKKMPMERKKSSAEKKKPSSIIFGPGSRKAPIGQLGKEHSASAKEDSVEADLSSKGASQTSFRANQPKTK